MENDNKEHSKKIATLEEAMKWLKKDVIGIKKQVFNHIPTSIIDLKQSINDDKLSNSKWRVGLLVGIIFLIVEIFIAFMLNRL